MSFLLFVDVNERTESLEEKSKHIISAFIRFGWEFRTHFQLLHFPYVENATENSSTKNHHQMNVYNLVILSCRRADFFIFIYFYSVVLAVRHLSLNSKYKIVKNDRKTYAKLKFSVEL